MQVVNTTYVALTSSQNPSVSGNNVTLTATVAAGADGKTVSFKDGVTEIGSSSAIGGVATFTTNLLNVGSHSITAVYDGTVLSPILVQVVNGSISVALTSSKNPSNTGEQVGLTATVTGVTTGTVSFKDGSATIGTANISGGAAILNYTFSTAGTHSITAVYGTTNSAAYAQVVNSTTAVILSLSVNPSNQSQSVKFTAMVNGGTGSVKFYDGTTFLTTVYLTGGVSTLTTSALSVDSHVIKEQYFNTSNVLVSEASLTQVVTILSMTLATSKSSVAVKTNVTFTATGLNYRCYVRRASRWAPVLF